MSLISVRPPRGRAGSVQGPDQVAIPSAAYVHGYDRRGLGANGCGIIIWFCVVIIFVIMSSSLLGWP